jgi:hypothetical protein
MKRIWVRTRKNVRITEVKDVSRFQIRGLQISEVLQAVESASLLYLRWTPRSNREQYRHRDASAKTENRLKVLKLFQNTNRQIVKVLKIFE